MASIQTDARICLHPMPQLNEALDRSDDWTGVTSATERRRLQNRLNSRAFRRRRAQDQTHPRIPHSTATENVYIDNVDVDVKVLIPHWSEDYQAVIPVPVPASASKIRRDSRYDHHQDPCRPLLPYTATPTTLDRVYFPLSPDHLLTLLQYNVLRACLVNRGLVSRLLDSQGDAPSYSTRPVVLPDLASVTLSRLLPQSLYPTAFQKTVPHAAWIDILPHPTLRDNLITLTTANCRRAVNVLELSASDSGSAAFDEDALWTDTVGGLFEGFADIEADHAGGIVWDSPWDIAGWELSEIFWRKYRCMFTGCEAEVLGATNRWRQMRGEEDLRQ